MGSGGLGARLRRHCRPGGKRHWHIDFFRPATHLEGIWIIKTGERVECAWAAAVLSLPGANVPAPCFGASDCRCASHLVHFEWRPEPTALTAALGIPASALGILSCDELVVG